MSSPEERNAEFAESRQNIINAAEDCKKPLPQSWYFRRAWDKGVLAKEMGFARVSPYYEDELREPYWLAGYDGIPFAPPMIVKQIQPGTRTPPRASELKASKIPVEQNQHAPCETA
jgi:hypothetical protein